MNNRLFAVRAKPETFALFDALHERLQQQLPYGALTRAETLHLIISSASALAANGDLLATVAQAQPPGLSPGADQNLSQPQP